MLVIKFQNYIIKLWFFNIQSYKRESNPNITQWMAEKNFTAYHQLEAYYTNKLLGITKNLGKRATVWQDVYDNGVRVRLFILFKNKYQILI